MKVFVAGASGAIGRPLVRQLVAAGHEVTGTTRRPERAEEIRAGGATAVVCDVFDAAALAAGARRYVTQSIAFIYAPEGDWVKDEEAPTFDDAPPPFDEGVRAMLAHEREVLGSEGIEGLVLRYGQFYGPGTYYTPGDGSLAKQVERRLLPIVGDGAGMASFVHVEDAAGATVAALDRGAPGIYNVADDDPAPAREWLPAYAAALGAKPPRRVPRWLARLVGGRFAVLFGAELRGASNAKAKRELAWQPRYPSWRQGFQEALG